MRIPILIPNIFQVVLLHGTVFLVQESTGLADEDAVIQHAIARFVLHAVNAKLVEFVIKDFEV